jgi:hypothetical protein
VGTDEPADIGRDVAADDGLPRWVVGASDAAVSQWMSRLVFGVEVRAPMPGLVPDDPVRVELRLVEVVPDVWVLDARMTLQLVPAAGVTARQVARLQKRLAAAAGLLTGYGVRVQGIDPPTGAGPGPHAWRTAAPDGRTEEARHYSRHNGSLGQESNPVRGATTASLQLIVQHLPDAAAVETTAVPMEVDDPSEVSSTDAGSAEASGVQVDDATGAMYTTGDLPVLRGGR